MKVNVWIRTGRACRIIGLGRTQFKELFIGRIKCRQTPGGHWQWDLEEVLRLAGQERLTAGTAGTADEDVA